MSTAPTVIDGRTVRSPLWRRAGRRAQRALVRRAEREELVLEQQLRSHAGVTRPNLVAVAGPAAGVGRTTTATVIGTLLTTHVRARTIVVGAGDDPVDALLDVATAAELRRHVDTLPSGLHRLDADHVTGQLLAFLALFYEVVVVDLGTEPDALVLDRADHVVWVVRPDPATINPVRRAAPGPDATIVLNGTGSTRIEAMIAQQRPADPLLRGAVDIPSDARLGAMLTTGTFTVGALNTATRIALKRLAVAVAGRLA